MELNKHVSFYQREIDEIEWKTKEEFETPSVQLWKSCRLFLGRYDGFDAQRGNVFISFRKDDPGLPRINEEFSCFVVVSRYAKADQWGAVTYTEMLDELGENDISEVKLVAFRDAGDPSRIQAIFSDADLKFINRLVPKMKLIVGPKEPPLEYLGNLKKLSARLSGQPNGKINRILEQIEEKDEERLPLRLFENEQMAETILKEADEQGLVIIQGPPGVGKTHLAGLILSKIIDSGKSVLLTALTNKAAVEVCGKKFFKGYIKAGKVFKASLKASEANLYPGLQNIADIKPVKGAVILATYYTYSRCWQEMCQPLFDYVIIEEASQAFLTTIASGMLVGKKVIVIGDPCQIQTIVNQNSPEKVDQTISTLINGLETTIKFKMIPFFRKVESRRLNQRSIGYTNLFYQNQLVTLSGYETEAKKKSLGSIIRYTHNQGGPSLLKLELSSGKRPPEVKRLLIDLLRDCNLKELDVAILAPYRETVGSFQGEIMTELKNYKIVIDTVDRVQGLDVDICFYVVPNGSYDMSLQFNRFNVATSRAKLATYIIGDKSITTTRSGHQKVLEYIKRLDAEFSFCI